MHKHGGYIMATDLKDLAISYWRMERWVNNINAERKMAANSALRTIKKYLDSNGIEILDLLGNTYDPGMAVDVINNDVPDGADESKIVISEMIKPVIIKDGTVIQFGQVSIGLTVKKPIENKVKAEESDNTRNMSEELTELINCVKSQKSNKWKTIGIIISCVLIVFMIIETIILFDIGDSIKYKIENKGIISTIQAKDDNNKNEQKEKNDEDVENRDTDNVRLKEYIVQEGDTVLTICQKNNIIYEDNVEYIKNINGLYDINKIYSGQKLLIPIKNMEEK